MDIVGGLVRLGIDIDVSLNQSAASGIQRISTPVSSTAVFIVPAQEDLMIAVHVQRMAQQEARETSHIN
jgi:acetate kinase